MKISERKFSGTVYATKKSGKYGIVILFIISGSEVVRKKDTPKGRWTSRGCDS